MHTSHFMHAGGARCCPKRSIRQARAYSVLCPVPLRAAATRPVVINAAVSEVLEDSRIDYTQLEASFLCCNKDAVPGQCWVLVCGCMPISQRQGGGGEYPTIAGDWFTLAHMPGVCVAPVPGHRACIR